MPIQQQKNGDGYQGAPEGGFRHEADGVEDNSAPDAAEQDCADGNAIRQRGGAHPDQTILREEKAQIAEIDGGGFGHGEKET